MASSRMTALLGLLAVAGYQNRHRLKEMLSQATGQRGSNPESRVAASDAEPTKTAGTASPGGGGILGTILGAGGSSQGSVMGGLRDLIEQFTGGPQAEVAKSWVATGPNRDIDTVELERTLGPDTIEALARQTGLSREDLLVRLKSVLPTAVDSLTPDGRVPNESDPLPR